MAFVIFFVIEKAVTPDAAPGNTLDLVHFDNGILSGGLSVSPEEIVTRRKEQLMNLDH